MKLFLELIKEKWLFFITKIEQKNLLLKIKKNTDIPDKCDICGLRAKYKTGDIEIDNAIKKAWELKEYGITENFPRIINVSAGDEKNEDYTYFCVLSNLKYWNKPLKKCPDWQLRIDNKLELNDHLAIHQSRMNRSLSLKLSTIAITLTTIIILLNIIKD